MAAGYGYASAPQEIESNSSASTNSLYTGLGVAAVAGSLGMAYGMDIANPDDRKRVAAERKERRKERANTKRERMANAEENRRAIKNGETSPNEISAEDADPNRRLSRQQKADQANQQKIDEIRELRQTNSRSSNTEADKLEKSLAPHWRQQLMEESERAMPVIKSTSSGNPLHDKVARAQERIDYLNAQGKGYDPLDLVDSVQDKAEYSYRNSKGQMLLGGAHTGQHALPAPTKSSANALARIASKVL